MSAPFLVHHAHQHPSHIITMFLLGSFSAYLISKILEPAKLTEKERQDAQELAKQGGEAVEKAGAMAAALQNPAAMLQNPHLMAQMGAMHGMGQEEMAEMQEMLGEGIGNPGRAAEPQNPAAQPDKPEETSKYKKILGPVLQRAVESYKFIQKMTESTPHGLEHCAFHVLCAFTAYRTAPSLANPIAYATGFALTVFRDPVLKFAQQISNKARTEEVRVGQQEQVQRD